MTRGATRDRWLLALLPLTVALACGGLFRRPDALLVDPLRASVDRAHRGHPRGVGNDLTTVFLPRFVLIRRSLEAVGRPAFWDPSGFGGRPLLGNPQAGLLYPPVWLAWGAGSWSALGWLTVAHLMGAGFGTYLLSRSAGVSRPAAVVAGGCYECAPYLIGHVFEGHYPHVWAACWYPWGFWAWGEAARGRARGDLFLPLVLALALLAGHAQEWYYLVLALGAWALADGFVVARLATPGRGVRVFVAWLMALATGVGLCGAELLPQAEAWPLLLRTSRLGVDAVSHYQVGAANLAQLLHPQALGGPSSYAGPDNYWETLLSFGFVPLVLAVVGLREDRRGGRWGLLVLFAVVFAAGRKLGFYTLLYATLPGMDRFRAPGRTLFLASLAVAVLAGMGVDALRGGAGGRPGTRRGLLGAFGAWFALGLVCFGLRVFGAMPPVSAGREGLLPGFARLGAVPVFWTAAPLALALAWWVRPGRAVGAWLGGVALGEVVLLAAGVLTYARPEDFGGRGPVVERLEVVRAAEFGPFRVASMEKAFSDLRAAAFGFEKTNVNDGFQLQNAADLYEQLYLFLDPVRPPKWGTRPMDGPVTRFRAEAAKRVLDRMSVGALVTDFPAPVPGLDAPAAVRGPDGGRYALAVNRGALPRAAVVPRAAPSRPRTTQDLTSLETDDPRECVMLEGGDPLPPGDRQPFLPARWRSDHADSAEVVVETRAPGFLLVTNTWHPGWTARVDGHAAPVLRANHAQQAVPLPTPGLHRIELRFRPPGLEAGLAVTGVAALFWVLRVGGACLRGKGPVFRPNRGASGPTIPG